MALIYLLLTSVSIIFGYRSRNAVLGQRVYPCSRCGKQSYHTLVRSRRWFTLYFIPVIPVTRSTTSRCNLCGYQEAISNEQADAWFPKGQKAGAAPKEVPASQPAQAPYVSQKTPEQLMDEAATLSRAGRFAEALALYDQVLQTTPNNPGAHYCKGDALCGLGRYPEAIQAYDRAIQLAPQVHNAYSAKGKALESMGRTEEAQQAYATARQLETRG